MTDTAGAAPVAPVSAPEPPAPSSASAAPAGAALATPAPVAEPAPASTPAGLEQWQALRAAEPAAAAVAKAAVPAARTMTLKQFVRALELAGVAFLASFGGTLNATGGRVDTTLLESAAISAGIGALWALARALGATTTP